MDIRKVPITIIKDDGGYFFNGGYCPNREEILKAKELLDSCLEKTDKEIEIWNKECRKFHMAQALEKERTNIPHKQKQTGYIYVYKQDSFYKIGRSKKEDCRRYKYITENPNTVELILKFRVDDYIKVESDIHKLFNKKKHNREWFTLLEEDILKIKEIYGTTKNV